MTLIVILTTVVVGSVKAVNLEGAGIIVLIWILGSFFLVFNFTMLRALDLKSFNLLMSNFEQKQKLEMII